MVDRCPCIVHLLVVLIHFEYHQTASNLGKGLFDGIIHLVDADPALPVHEALFGNHQRLFRVAQELINHSHEVLSKNFNHSTNQTNKEPTNQPNKQTQSQPTFISSISSAFARISLISSSFQKLMSATRSPVRFFE